MPNIGMSRDSKKLKAAGTFHGCFRASCRHPGLPRKMMPKRSLSSFIVNSPIVESLTNITELKLIHLRLQILPESIGQLTQLRKLNLSKNRLIELPPFVMNLSHLRTLDLSYNYLTFIPEEISQLKKLEMIDIQGNQISNLVELSDKLPDMSWNIDNDQYRRFSKGVQAQLLHAGITKIAGSDAYLNGILLLCMKSEMPPDLIFLNLTKELNKQFRYWSCEGRYISQEWSVTEGLSNYKRMIETSPKKHCLRLKTIKRKPWEGQLLHWRRINEKRWKMKLYALVSVGTRS